MGEEEEDGVQDALSSGETLGSAWLILPGLNSSAILSRPCTTMSLCRWGNGGKEPPQKGKLR